MNDDGVSPWAHRLLDGLSFADLASDSGPALWGEGDRILWSPGEPFMIYGPQGVGKTTLAQRLLLARAGIESMLLGLPVTTTERRTLYIAADRPRQASRAWGRLLSLLDEDQCELVRERVVFWTGPLPFDVAMKPEGLLDLAIDLDAGTVIGDSLKDVAMDLVKDEVGSRVNLALQLLVSNDIEVLMLHHPRKSQPGSKASKDNLDAVYGSAWLTAGHGSVVQLWGSPGDPVVEFTHLKTPIEEVGPFTVRIDHHIGMVDVMTGGNELEIVRAARGPLTAAHVARLLFSTLKPTKAQVEKARRRLDKLPVTLVHVERGGRDERGRPMPVTYCAIEGRVGEPPRG